MTGAGSGEALRQQLEAALERFRLTGSADLVYAVVAAARVATATEIAEALEAMKPEELFVRRRDAVAIALAAGGSVPAPQQAYCKPCDRWHVPGKHDPVPAPKGDRND